MRRRVTVVDFLAQSDLLEEKGEIEDHITLQEMQELCHGRNEAIFHGNPNTGGHVRGSIML